jgi:hypothetical protein
VNEKALRTKVVSIFAGFVVSLLAVAEPAKLTVDQGHAWRPPFGLDRVGAPFEVLVEIDEPVVGALYRVVGQNSGGTLETTFTPKDSKRVARRFKLTRDTTQVELFRDVDSGKRLSIAQLAIDDVPFECAAEATVDPVVNPVNLGAIFPPADWLLIGAGQTAVVNVAAFTLDPALTSIAVSATFESNAAQRASTDLALKVGERATGTLSLPFPAGTSTSDSLTIRAVSPAGTELYARKVNVMIVRELPAWPAFGATQTKLRYDAPISVRKEDGSFGEMDYASAWDPALQDVVVSFPNGARYVFWRGSSYVPFWAGKYNTGLSYEWAETMPPKDGFTDCVEPLMDKELRYGRVEIVESTPARVHVRWTYQSCDFKYKVWGDAAQEDYVFYPDGFGTRTLTLQSVLDANYELSEFIILTPAATYPLRVLPDQPVDMLFPDGEKRIFKIPLDAATRGDLMKPREAPFLFRVRTHKDDPMAAIYFHPVETKMAHFFFDPFFDQGEMVTPCYWGSHWPLARGQTTGGSINDRVALSPCHNSLMTWAFARPEPLRKAYFEAPDTLGRSGPRMLQVWTWLIGASDADDARLVQWANSFGHSPSVEVEGARLEPESFSLERRALRVVAEKKDVSLTLMPQVACVNPVIEIRSAPAKLARVSLEGSHLPLDRFAWDGKTLWVDTALTAKSKLELSFVD